MMEADVQLSSPSNSSTFWNRWRISRPTSKGLALLAIVLWLLSLLLPGLVIPSHVDDLQFLRGYQILSNGWMGAIGGLFSWYVNPLFLLVCWKLLKTNKCPAFAAGLSVVLAGSMFFYSNIPSLPNAVAVYGYGWGAYLWCTAILLTPVAVSVKRLEQRNQYSGIQAIWHEEQGAVWLILLVTWVTGSFSVGLYQKVIASDTERGRLYNVVFERGPICTTPDHKVLTSIPLDGALQISDDSDTYPGVLNSPTSLIAWGIPIVRKGRFDFYRSDSSPDWHLVAGPPTEPVSAKLTTQRTYDRRYVIRARLSSVDDKIVAFDAKWLSGIDRDPHYCPGYFPAADENEPPRDLLLSALARPGGKFVPPPKQRLLFEGQDYSDMVATQVTVVGKVKLHEIAGNISCPVDVGVRHLRLTKAKPAELNFMPPSSWNIPTPQSVDVLYKELSEQAHIVFQIQEHFHIINSIHDFGAACGTHDVYLGWGHVHGPTYQDDYFFLQKRSLPQFQKTWTRDRRIRFRRSGEEANAPYQKFHLYSVNENGDSLSIILAYFEKDAEVGDLIKVVVETGIAPSQISKQQQ